ncbi:hypothetical protein P154DRAFT_615242 [Amniculicola lignicola CBS 123094]|uniref:Peptidase A1 domain-containing protein n=1 Tax=Amniculicola lignicola CBS 123094 TaxID=1392246 RepID=A0A6A5WXF4_9PLEO|nr:hypothetical protein P154DRAFT_615242 [Amniculicola lignicola CBS 123094]
MRVPHYPLLLAPIVLVICEPVIIPPSAPFSIPILGPALDPSTPWGVRITGTFPEPGKPVGRSFYDIAIRFTRPFFAGMADEILLDTLTPPSNPPTFLGLLGDADNPLLFLGPDSNLSAFTNEAGRNDVDIPTLPFGLNLGFLWRFNGSITLNAYYDANRINSTSWIPLPNSAKSQAESTFLFNGTFPFSAKVNNTACTAILDFNSDAIVLPPGYSCKDLTVEIVDAEPKYNIHIPEYLLSNTTRCLVRNETVLNSDPRKDTVVLGKPFFQAAYVYVEKSGQVYIARANDYDLAPKPEKFDKGAILRPPGQPEGYKPVQVESAANGLVGSVYLRVGVGILTLWASTCL